MRDTSAAAEAVDGGRDEADTRSFLKSLGFPEVRVHRSFNHFDFTRPSRRILVIGSMGSGKTEFSARVWRDAEVALRKTGAAAERTRTDGADRRRVFFIRTALDAKRFPHYPKDALPYRGGYVRCGDNIAEIADSFDAGDGSSPTTPGSARGSSTRPRSTRSGWPTSWRTPRAAAASPSSSRPSS